ncbi:GNAT family N-acetyltransferase [uncultured Mailhella sp.]|uniref:GNAT family N-acetyltransferase n=1 Tax=uncultured Mailhella sp. TaxID=1981031 RepID=UPI002606BABA|nr:GNAT family N-acetyltransferase [uncultured Mailhella sp.]
MKERITVSGFGYRLRPVEVTDAQFIIDTRLEDARRNCFIHPISPDVSEQEAWLKAHVDVEDDYYFVVENLITGEPEGLIGIYHIKDGVAEWGRWVIRKSSLAAVESVDLMYQAAFERLGLEELYCLTLSDSTAVVSFHDAIGQKNGGIIRDYLSIDGKKYDAVKHYVDRQYYYETVQETLQSKAFRIFERSMKMALGECSFHHIGVAAKNLSRELKAFQMLGYKKEGTFFEDRNQGIGGQFLVARNQPRLELLVNLPGSETLSPILAQGGKLYHFGYQVENFAKALELFERLGCRVMREPRPSAYFGKRIAFFMLKNMFLVELIEK